MNKLIQQEKSEPMPLTGLSARLPFLNSFFQWLTDLVYPSKEDQKNAGVYLGGEGRD